MSKKGWVVTFSGTGLNLTLGCIYAWSVFGKQMTEAVENGGWGWTKTQVSLPFTAAVAVWAVMMIPAGRLQDRLGPRIVATAGALLLGIGMVVASFASAGSVTPAIVGFGILSGMGMSLGYCAATPAAIKWFPPQKKGFITGLVIAGLGLASVYVAPLAKYLLGEYGLSSSFRILGIAFAVVAGLICQNIVNPPQAVSAPIGSSSGSPAVRSCDATWREMMRTPIFYPLYVQFVSATTAGLMIIGHLAKIVAMQSDNTISAGFLFVAVLAFFNASGRVVCGFLSDYLGRSRTILLVSVMQAAIMLLFSKLSTMTGFFIGAALVGFNYGACMPVFAATAADLWGTKNFGMNYGILFTAWGVAGVIGPILGGLIADATGTYTMAFVVAATMCVVAAVLSVVIQGMTKKYVAQRES